MHALQAKLPSLLVIQVVLSNEKLLWIPLPTALKGLRKADVKRDRLLLIEKMVDEQTIRAPCIPEDLVWLGTLRLQSS